MGTVGCMLCRFSGIKASLKRGHHRDDIKAPNSFQAFQVVFVVLFGGWGPLDALGFGFALVGVGPWVCVCCLC